jgi:Protein of unknown function (DUF2809)
MCKRYLYILFVGIIMILGLASRKFSEPTSWVFLYLGDVLWATMFYFIFRFLFIRKTFFINALITITWCFVIEFSQLYQSDWINAVRATMIGALILGSGFLGTDLACYIIGVGLGFAIDRNFPKILIRRIPSEGR